jgi:NAD-dependent dihydropyrimidine dehydrogenase PreA subunit
LLCSTQSESGNRNRIERGEIYVSKIDPIYKELATKMNAPNNKALPKLLQKIANLEQARIASALPSTVENIASKLALDKEKVAQHLQYLFERGLVAPGRSGWNMVNNIGIFKDLVASANDKYDDDEVFDLAREMSLEDAKSLKGRIKRGEKIPPVRKVMRVVPKWRAIKDIPGILPIEDAREIFKNKSPIVVHKCPCRMVYRDRPCKDTQPVEVCLAVGKTGQRFLERSAGKTLTYDELIAFLDKVDKSPLVSTTGNSNRMPEVLCSCCNDCCGLFVRQSYTKPLLGQVPYEKSRFVVEYNPELCVACGTCVKRCPVHAANKKDSKEPGKKQMYTDTEECIGCGLCVLTCPKKARKLKLVRPPEHIPDFAFGLDTEGLPIAPPIPQRKV